MQNFLQQQVSLLNAILTPLKPNFRANQAAVNTQYQAGQACPQCQSKLETRQAIKGSKIGQSYIGCSNFPDCRFYHWP